MIWPSAHCSRFLSLGSSVSHLSLPTVPFLSDLCACLSPFSLSFCTISATHLEGSVSGCLRAGLLHSSQSKRCFLTHLPRPPHWVGSLPLSPATWVFFITLAPFTGRFVKPFHQILGETLSEAEVGKEDGGGGGHRAAVGDLLFWTVVILLEFLLKRGGIYECMTCHNFFLSMVLQGFDSLLKL